LFKKTAIIIVFILIITACLFLFGPLFVYSPVILGFEKKEFSRAVLYYHKGADISGYMDTDRLVEEMEKFHGMKLKRKPEIVIMATDSERFRLSLGKARMTTYLNRIIVAGRVADEAATGKIHLETYLKHELSHVVLFSGADIIHAYFFPEWLREGLAVYAANQRGVDGYYTGTFVREMTKKGLFLPPGKETAEMRRVLKKELPGTTGYFMYSEWATIVEAIINEYGKEKFMEYASSVLGGGNYRKEFRKAFGRDFDAYISAFAGGAA
jgi:hypothetical protein